LRVDKAACGEIACKEDLEPDVRFGRDSPQQRRLVLDRVGYKVSQPYHAIWSQKLWRTPAAFAGLGIGVELSASEYASR
jgi:hypothetical protein